MVGGAGGEGVVRAVARVAVVGVREGVGAAGAIHRDIYGRWANRAPAPREGHTRRPGGARGGVDTCGSDRGDETQGLGEVEVRGRG